MVYREEDDFRNFRCIAGACPESCCEGWQIVIDEDSLKRYQEDKTPFGKRLAGSIDWQEGTFKQQDRRCLMLNDRNLCDLVIAEGEGSLCRTCHLFPRHMEEYEDVREYTLDLSCPEAAKSIVERTTSFSMTEREDQTEDDPSEYEDFDFLLYDRLCAARDIFMTILDRKDLTLRQKSDRILDLAARLDQCYQDDRIFDMDGELDREAGRDKAPCKGKVPDKGKEEGINQTSDKDREEAETLCASCGTFDEAKQTFKVLYQLEKLHPDWDRVLDQTQKDVFSDRKVWQSVMCPDDDLPALNILRSLLYTYFCGAVYDGEIFARAAFCVQSLRWALMIGYSFQKEEADADPRKALTRALYQYCREVEHSDSNLDTLFEFFIKQVGV